LRYLFATGASLATGGGGGEEGGEKGEESPRLRAGNQIWLAHRRGKKEKGRSLSAVFPPHYVGKRLVIFQGGREKGGEEAGPCCNSSALKWKGKNCDTARGSSRFPKALGEKKGEGRGKAA